MGMDDSLAIGVDLGATKIASALVTREGEVLATRQTPTLVKEGARAVINRIAADVQALRGAAPEGRKVLGVGIGSPGWIDSTRGIVFGAVNMLWKDVALGEELGNRLGDFPIVVENDANANAVGEGYFGSAKGSRDYVLLTIGSGLGSGVVAGGHLITGARFGAADLGHISLDPDHGMPCACGQVGCAETICSGPGLVRVARQLLKKGGKTTLVDSEALSSAEVVAAARAGDAVGLAAMEVLARAMGHVAAIAGAVIDPDVIVVGGGLGVAVTDLISEGMAKEYRRRVPRMVGDPAIRAATLASPAIGSAGLVWSRVELVK